MLNPRMLLPLAVGVFLGGLAALMILYDKPGRRAVNRILTLAGLRDSVVDRFSFGMGTDARKMDWQRVAASSNPQWNVRPGFDVKRDAGGFSYPVNIAFVSRPSDAADAPLYYVSELHGTIKYVSRDRQVHTYASDLNNFAPIPQVRSDETGLSGLMVVPQSDDLLVTGSYQDDESGLLSNHILRLVSEPGGKAMREKTVLLDLQEFTAPGHQVQQIKHGPDGKLYVSVGDGENHYMNLDLDKFGGKILRLNYDGSACSDNPFFDKRQPASPRSYVFAYGVRNVFDFDFDAETGRLFAADNGHDIDRFLRIDRGAGYCWNGEWDSMRANALYTWGPPDNVAPTGLTFLKHDSLGDRTRGNCYLGTYGPYAASGANQGKSIVEFMLDRKNGQLQFRPEHLVQYAGRNMTTVLGLAEGPDGLYFTDFFGEIDANLSGDEAQGQGAVWKVVPSSGVDAQVNKLTTDLSGLSALERGRILFARHCATCHRLSGHGGGEGPELTHAHTRLNRQLNSPAYVAHVQRLLSSDKAFVVEQHTRLREVMQADGQTRLETWLTHHLQEPRFDNLRAKMPSFARLPEAERQTIIAYLMTLQ